MPYKLQTSVNSEGFQWALAKAERLAWTFEKIKSVLEEHAKNGSVPYYAQDWLKTARVQLVEELLAGDGPGVAEVVVRFLTETIVALDDDHDPDDPKPVDDAMALVPDGIVAGLR